jgi:hypothetical protein
LSSLALDKNTSDEICNDVHILFFHP